MFKAMVRLVKNTAKYAVNKVKNFFVGVYKHAETITVMSLSAIGANVLIGEIPFYASMPMWIEAAMVVPVLSVLIVLLLVRSAEWRANRRGVYVAAA